MQTEIPIDEATNILSNAFHPLHCGAENFDFDYLRFRVFDTNDEAVLRMAKLTADDYGSPKALQNIIEHARANLQRRGFALDPWKMSQGPWGAT